MTGSCSITDCPLGVCRVLHKPFEMHDLKSLLWEQPRVQQHLSADDLDALFDVDYHLRHIEVPFARLGLG